MSKLNPEEVKIKPKKCRRRKRKDKLTIVFDENARREFLTGFHKRKLQRKNRAKEELEKQLKAERKRIKTEAKEQYMKLLLRQKPLPEISDLLSEDIDMGTHSVSVTELSASELARKSNWIGMNEVQYQEREIDDSNEILSKSEDEVVGMEVEKKNNEKSRSNTVWKNSKDIKKEIRQQATNNVKNSKIFKKKSQLEKIKNIKFKRKQERLSEKIKKRSKHKKKCNRSF